MEKSDETLMREYQEGGSDALEQLFGRYKGKVFNFAYRILADWAVAEFGLLLRDSEFKGSASCGQVLEAARQSKGQDPWGYREGFIELVQRARDLSGAGTGGIGFKGDPETR